MEGWIKLHRKILDHYLFNEDRVFSKYEAWEYIILSANHSDSKFLLGNELIQLKAGQLVTSQSKLMEKFKWSKSKLKNFFELLSKDGMLKVETDTKKTTLTVVKYKDYQHLETAKRPTKDREESAKSLRKDTNKNVKNDNNVKNEKEIPTMAEFFAYAQEHKQVDYNALKLKYESWKVNDWCIERKGKKKPILNWKTTLLNTLPYIKEKERELHPYEELYGRTS